LLYFETILSNIDYAQLINDNDMRNAFVATIKASIINHVCESVPCGITPAHIDLDLSPGSVVVAATIRPATGMSVNRSKSVWEGNQMDFLDDVASDLHALRSLAGVITGPIRVAVTKPIRVVQLDDSEDDNSTEVNATDLDDETSSTASTTTPPRAPTMEEDARASVSLLILIVCAILLVLLVGVGSACARWKRAKRQAIQDKDNLLVAPSEKELGIVVQVEESREGLDSARLEVELPCEEVPSERAHKGMRPNISSDIKSKLQMSL
jgi:hypothetical protein